MLLIDLLSDANFKILVHAKSWFYFLVIVFSYFATDESNITILSPLIQFLNRIFKRLWFLTSLYKLDKAARRLHYVPVSHILCVWEMSDLNFLLKSDLNFNDLLKLIGHDQYLLDSIQWSLEISCNGFLRSLS